MKRFVLAVSLLLALCSTGYSATQQQVDMERSRLDQWLANKMRTCPDNTGCISSARDQHRNKMNMLMANPDAYFMRSAPSQQPVRGGGYAQASDPNCHGNCGSDHGICMGRCMGNGQCISQCAQQHGRCVSRCR